MRLFIRSPFFLITSSLFFILYFVSSAYADHTPHAHKPRKAGLPGYNEACDNINGSFRAATPLVGQLDPTVDEKGRPTEKCINFTRYGYPINPGEPGYIDRNVPPSSFGRPPRDSGQYSIACDSRQDTSPYGNNTWESGSCVDDAGRPCCINQTLEGYPIEPGDPRYVISELERKICEDPDSFPGPPQMREMEMQRLKPVCDALAQKSSTPQPGNPVQQQTFESYQPPEIACQAPGAWAAVDRNGKGIQQNGRVQFIVCTCDVCGPGAASKFNNIPDRDPNSYKHVFANTKQVGLSGGDDATYSFKTGLWTTSAGQFRDGIPVSGSGSSPGTLPPIGPDDSPAQAELARATAARQEAEQQVNSARAIVGATKAALETAQQQLATAQVTLASAREAKQAVEQAAKQAAEQQAAKRAIAERAVQDAEQQSTSVNMELETAARSLVLLEQQRDNAQKKVTFLEARRDEALRILNDARAKVAQITGMEFIGDIQDSTVDPGTDPGTCSNQFPLKTGCRFTPVVVAASGGSGEQCSPTNAIQGSIPLRIICPSATSAEPFRGVLDVEGPTDPLPFFAVKIKTGPSWDPKWRTRITLHPDPPAIDPSERGRPVTAEIYLGFGVQPGETKFYPIQAEGKFVLIKSIDGAVDIDELSFIEGCRQPDGSINRCSGRGPVGGDITGMQFVGDIQDSTAVEGLR